MGKIPYVHLIILPLMPDNVYTGTALKKTCQSICSGMFFLCFVCFEWSFARIGIHFRKLPVKQIFKPQFHIRLRTAVWINVPILVLSPYPSNCASTMAMAVLLSVPTR